MRAMMHPALFLPAGFQLAATVLLAVLPLISATDTSQFSRRDAGKDAGSLPKGWLKKFCFADDPNQPTLTSMSFMAPFMTVALCTHACANASLALAGLENGNKCSCGNITTDSALIIPDSNCETNCAGDHSVFCGGPNNLQLYWNGKALQPSPTIVQSMDLWNLKGCYSDSNDARTLSKQIDVQGGDSGNGGVTIEECLDGCDSDAYDHAGVQFANQCWCGKSINPSGQELDLQLCRVLACAGNSSDYCGGAHTMIIYNLPVESGD